MFLDLSLLLVAVVPSLSLMCNTPCCDASTLELSILQVYISSAMFAFMNKAAACKSCIVLLF